MVPRARIANVETQEMPGELLVYDLDRQHAHCLNRTAALVWQRCDGTTSVGQIADALRTELDPAADEVLVSLTVEDLERARLLEMSAQGGTESRLSRRELVRNAGIAMLLPVVMSVAAPTVAQASSGHRGGAKKRGLGKESAPGQTRKSKKSK